MTVPAPAAPRALTPLEKAQLRYRLREAGDGDAADDEGLLAFVLDMAESGEAAGRVPEELLKLEMCSEAEAEKIGACLAEFFDSLEARQQGLQAETTPVTMSGQHRGANSNTSAPGGRVRVEVTKPTKDYPLGIGLTGRRGAVSIYAIAEEGLFAGTNLKVGQVVETINGERFETATEATAWLRAADGWVEIVTLDPFGAATVACTIDVPKAQSWVEHKTVFKDLEGKVVAKVYKQDTNGTYMGEGLWRVGLMDESGTPIAVLQRFGKGLNDCCLVLRTAPNWPGQAPKWHYSQDFYPLVEIRQSPFGGSFTVRSCKDNKVLLKASKPAIPWALLSCTVCCINWNVSFYTPGERKLAVARDQKAPGKVQIGAGTSPLLGICIAYAVDRMTGGPDLSGAAGDTAAHGAGAILGGVVEASLSAI